MKKIALISIIIIAMGIIIIPYIQKKQTKKCVCECTKLYPADFENCELRGNLDEIKLKTYVECANRCF